MEGLRQVFLDFTSFGAGQAGSSEMDSAKFVKLAKVRNNIIRLLTTVVSTSRILGAAWELNSMLYTLNQPSPR